MKILFPVINNTSEKDVLAPGLQKTKYVGIYSKDLGTWQHVHIDDLATGLSTLPAIFKANDIFSVVSSHVRPLALQIFQRCGITVYEPKGSQLQENIDLFLQGDLDAYSIEASRELLGCNGECGPCSTDCN